MQKIVNRAWAEFEPSEISEQGLAREDELNFFSFDAEWVDRRLERLRLVLEGVECILRGEKPSPEMRPTRYRTGLSTVSRGKLRALAGGLREYIVAAEETAAMSGVERLQPRLHGSGRFLSTHAGSRQDPERGKPLGHSSTVRFGVRRRAVTPP